MKAFFAAALAVSLAAGSVAAQATHRTRRARRPATSASSEATETPESRARTRLKLWEDGAILLAARLESRQDSSAEHLHTDANALGRNIADAESALDELRRGSKGAEKARLDSVRTHFKEARKEYDQLRKAEPDAERVATHAAALHQQLSAAQRILAPRVSPPPARRAKPPRRKRHARNRRTVRS